MKELLLQLDGLRKLFSEGVLSYSSYMSIYQNLINLYLEEKI